MCDVFLITAMCHHSSHDTSTSHLHVVANALQVNICSLAMRWRHPRAEGRPSAAAQQDNKKAAEHGSAVFDTASLSYPEAATNFMAQDRVRAYVC